MSQIQQLIKSLYTVIVMEK